MKKFSGDFLRVRIWVRRGMGKAVVVFIYSPQ